MHEISSNVGILLDCYLVPIVRTVWKGPSRFALSHPSHRVFLPCRTSVLTAEATSMSGQWSTAGRLGTGQDSSQVVWFM